MRDRKREGAEQEETPEVRVTDRRRIYLDDQAEQTNPEVEQPSLKPSYVEELEARTKAAERQVPDLPQQSRRVRRRCRS